MEAAGGSRSRRYEFGGETNASTTGLRLTLGGILSIKEPSPYRIRNRTLLDLIRDDPTCSTESKKTWKVFTEKLRLKLAGASHAHGSTDSSRITTQIVTNRSNSVSPPATNASSVPVTPTEIVQSVPPVEERERTSTEENRGGTSTVKVSLMSLLRIDGSGYFEGGDEEEEEAVVVEGGGGDGDGDGKYNNCCVCMVRHRGAAFIPCGHTFCRVCSRELFVKRAICPLCNHFILEILDIF